MLQTSLSRLPVASLLMLVMCLSSFDISSLSRMDMRLQRKFTFS